MPIYEYVCSNCRLRFEKLQSMNANGGTTCPACGHSVQRALSLFSAHTQGENGEALPIAGTGGCSGCAGGACACSTN